MPAAQRAADLMNYFANWGPLDGPLRDADCPGALGVFLDPAPRVPDGKALPSGLIADHKGAVATFRLTIGKTELPGRYLCVGRRFVPAQEWTARADRR